MTMLGAIGDFVADHLGFVAVGVVALLVVAIVAHARSEDRYEQGLLAHAHTFADTLAIQQIMAQRRTADAISFGAGLVAGSQAGSSR